MGALRALKRKKNKPRKKSFTFLDRERLKAENLLNNAAPELKKRIQEETWGMFCCVFAAWLRIEKGYGKKRIGEDFSSFVKLADVLINEETTPAQIEEMLRDETGFELMEHAQMLQDEAKREAENNV